MDIFITENDVKVEHEKGNKDCPECWDKETLLCQCGGIIHTDFGDENSDGDYWLYKTCENCDDPDPVEYGKTTYDELKLLKMRESLKLHSRCCLDPNVRLIP